MYLKALTLLVRRDYFCLKHHALLSEVFRSALLSIPRGQLEAGVSIGLSPFQTYRKIIIPQLRWWPCRRCATLP